MSTEPLSLMIDREIPFRGRCALCGAPDARHRELDVIAELVRAGETIEFVARTYGLSVELVRRVAAEYGDET